MSVDTTVTPEPRFIIAISGGKHVFLRWSDVVEYDSLITTLYRHFGNELPRDKENIVVQTNDLDICLGIFIDIPSELWGDISAQISRIRVVNKWSSEYKRR
ncbi:uncharacterized protein EV420DRAFT_1765759 [Desarmillaria tabescens]|uniref:Uncharacterized protein n=1 Tax=Armillaria tabescens TaxID=1929756 RepID=A0AA39K4F9_ARMTA|nr:uncharacterized protein EV420DRAFT_1765759 [Desarmillaria tabescens]KAK0454163.1 hypothetical protein EV420DRAFT_1765759 [Desarmillaria tabescens]